MLSKKAQISMYLILGIIILLFVLILSSPKKEQQTTSSSFTFATAAKSARLQVTECLREKIKEAVLFVAHRGGYAVPPENYVDFAAEESPLISSIPYYQVRDELFIPSDETVKKGIGDYLALTMRNCTGTIQLPDFNITFGVPLFVVDLVTEQTSSSKITVSAAIPTILTSVDTREQITISGYVVVIPSRLGEALRISRNIIGDNHLALCLSCMAQQTPRDMELQTFESNQPPDYVMVYQLLYNETFDETRLGTKMPAVFQFAAKYASDSNQTAGSINIINEHELASVTAVVGTPFSLDIKTNAARAPGQFVQPIAHTVQFSDDSDLFDIVADSVIGTGKIAFTPTPNMVGPHIIEIKATDETGAWDSTVMVLEVKEHE
ncbi:MAG: hypothetical protein Q7R76_00325 [Candidatus Woesearchaeota archaeon]|nr:hypothetical protein [Candidatus Woesearchaeota archaeon]